MNSVEVEFWAELVQIQAESIGWMIILSLRAINFTLIPIPFAIIFNFY